MDRRMFTGLAFILITTILWCSGGSSKPQETLHNEPLKRDDTIKCKYYNEKDFRISLDKANTFDIPQGKIRGGIAPHHLLAGSLIASFFEAASSQKPDLVVIFAPNHKGIGVKNVHTGGWSWQTPFGPLNAWKEAVDELTGSNIAAQDKLLLEDDHSVSALVPYIKYYMPEAEIVPVLLHGAYGTKNSIQLGQTIARIAKDRNCFIMSSVDFSHYLPVQKADIMDEISIKAIKERNLNRISLMNNDHMDSPPSIIALLSAMNELGAGNMSVLGHTNSARIIGRESDSTTSYFTVLFYE